MTFIGSLLSVAVLESATFPVARAAVEFRELLPHVSGYCERIQGDPEAFRRVVLPFGPLDLAVRNSRDWNEAKSLRGMYLGFAGRACNVDALGLAASFHCGAECTVGRRVDVVSRLEVLRKLVSDFRRIPRVWVIGQWGWGGEYRVNDFYRMMGGQTNEAVASRVMGFVPSKRWKRWSNERAFFESLGVGPESIESIVRRMRDGSVAAVVRGDEGTRVIRVGIAQNESGLLFMEANSALPALGTRGRDGRVYAVVEQVAQGVAFYETR